MGANAQTSVPAFTTGQVLTAQQQTEINTGVPVFATTTTRDAAFGGTGEKVLAEGQLAYIEASDVVQYYNGTAWATLAPQTLTSGLNYITGAAFTAVTSVSLPNNTFTSTYRNYRVIYQLTAASTATAITMRMRASGADKTDTNYYQCSPGCTSGGVDSNQGDNGISSWSMAGVDSTFPIYALTLDVIAPEVSTTEKHVLGNLFFFDGTTIGGRSINARKYETPAVAIDSLSLIKASGTFTGIYRVYGYSDS